MTEKKSPNLSTYVDRALDRLKIDVFSYIDKELEHADDRLNGRFQPVEKIIGDVEKNISKIPHEAVIRELARDESKKAQSKFMSNFKWFIGVTLFIFVIMFTVGIVSWADIRDYNAFKINIHNLISTNQEDINKLKASTFNQEVLNKVREIKEDTYELIVHKKKEGL